MNEKIELSNFLEIINKAQSYLLFIIDSNRFLQTYYANNKELSEQERKNTTIDFTVGAADFIKKMTGYEVQIYSLINDTKHVHIDSGNYELLKSGETIRTENINDTNSTSKD